MNVLIQYIIIIVCILFKAIGLMWHYIGFVSVLIGDHKYRTSEGLLHVITLFLQDVFLHYFCTHTLKKKHG